MTPERNAYASFSDFAPVNGTRIFYETRGTGHPLVLIHAGIADHRMWDAQIDTLAKHFQVVRYDARGFGQTISPAGPYYDHQDLYALLQFLELDKVSLVGVSNGGQIALNFTLEYPAMVTKLMLVGASVEGEPPDPDIQAGWAAIDAVEEEGDFAKAIELTIQMWVDGPNRRPEQVNPQIRENVRLMLQTLYDIPEEDDAGEEMALNPPANTRLGEIQNPTCLVVGDQDWPSKVALAERLANEIAGAELYLMPNVAHLPNMENPDMFNRILLQFLGVH